MGNFNRDNRSGGGGNFGRRDFSRQRSDRPMFKAVCSKCGNDCELPFKPSGERPVFCSKCFDTNGDFNSRRPDRRMDSQRPSFGDNRVFDAVCDKCGNDCKVPFQPTPGKPIFCSRCFEDKSKEAEKGGANYNEQFVLLNTKLDKILTILNTNMPVVLKKEKPAIVTETPKPVKQKSEVVAEKKVKKVAVPKTKNSK